MVKKSRGRPKKFHNSQTMAVQLESYAYAALDKLSHDHSIKENRFVSKGDLIRSALQSFINSELNNERAE